MKEIKNLLVIGGDERQIYMAKALAKSDFKVEIYGFEKSLYSDEKASKKKSLPKMIGTADAIILPLPASKDFKTVNAPFSSEDILLTDITEYVNNGQIVFAGMISEDWKSKFFQKGLKVYDYFKREELIVKNAVPTAQGVIKIIIDNVPTTISGLKCCVTGFGRTSKVLIKQLKALGADVTIAVRKCSDLAWIEIEGCKGTYIKDLCNIANQFDVIINTVPELIINEPILKNLNENCFIIEIASAPWGIDFTSAQELGIKVIRAGSLPGKVTPKTAGEIISEAIVNIIEEERK